MVNDQSLEYLGEPQYQPKTSVRDDLGRRLSPYLPEPGLVKAVNLSITLQRPLLLEGEPGCGKTLLARAIAYEWGQRYLDGKDQWPYIRWNITSRTQAQEGRYIYDALGRLRDAQMIGTESLQQYLGETERKELLKKLEDPQGYITWGKLGEAFQEENYPPILLIDEIDKADIDFPNDLLAELEEPSFTVAETQEPIRATHNPIVIITSNRERDLPEAFLRRCIFYYLEFPSPDRLKEIIQLHFPDQRQEKLYEKALTKFLEVRAKGAGRNSNKRASTSELLDWIRVLSGKTVKLAEKEIEELTKDPAQLGILLKSKADLDRAYDKSTKNS